MRAGNRFNDNKKYILNDSIEFEKNVKFIFRIEFQNVKFEPQFFLSYSFLILNADWGPSHPAKIYAAV